MKALEHHSTSTKPQQGSWALSSSSSVDQRAEGHGLGAPPPSHSPRTAVEVEVPLLGPQCHHGDNLT